MENCEKHEITIKVEGDTVITYCKKCGKILDTHARPKSDFTITCGTMPESTVQILHD